MTSLLASDRSGLARPVLTSSAGHWWPIRSCSAADGPLRRLPAHCETPGEEDRHHRHRPQADHPRLAPAHRRRTPRQLTSHRRSNRAPDRDAV